MPLVNRYVSPNTPLDDEPRYPLDVVMCSACSLVQITETVPPETLFSHYLYFSSYSDTVLTSARALVDRVCRERDLGGDDLVVELASNDGYLLQFYRDRGIPVLGVEPAENIARFAQDERGIPTLTEFFSTTCARRIEQEYGTARVIHAHNVLAHVADLNGFVQAMANLLRPDGLLVVEVPHLQRLLEKAEFDTIYHEHLCYFSLTSLCPLFLRHGLQVAHVEAIPLHGGSLRLFIEHTPARADASVVALEQQELNEGVGNVQVLKALGHRAAATRTALRSLLHDLRERNLHIAAYGAAAKGTILLNYCGLGAETIDYVVDRNTHKQGYLLPGVMLPILSPESLQIRRPDFILVLAWNILDEVMAQQELFRASGGAFIVPIPEPRIVR